MADSGVSATQRAGGVSVAHAGRVGEGGRGSREWAGRAEALAAAAAPANKQHVILVVQNNVTKSPCPSFFVQNFGLPAKKRWHPGRRAALLRLGEAASVFGNRVHLEGLRGEEAAPTRTPAQGACHLVGRGPSFYCFNLRPAPPALPFRPARLARRSASAPQARSATLVTSTPCTTPTSPALPRLTPLRSLSFAAPPQPRLASPDETDRPDPTRPTRHDTTRSVRSDRPATRPTPCATSPRQPTSPRHASLCFRIEILKRSSRNSQQKSVCESGEVVSSREIGPCSVRCPSHASRESPQFLGFRQAVAPSPNGRSPGDRQLPAARKAEAAKTAENERERNHFEERTRPRPRSRHRPRRPTSHAAPLATPPPTPPPTPPQISIPPPTPPPLTMPPLTPPPLFMPPLTPPPTSLPYRYILGRELVFDS
ncbi:Protein of unknown function [Gryllus bimaculatus]|nr:Protein of unknown function [Gryllus bimaculatus]